MLLNCKQLESLKKSATNMGDVEKFIQSVLGDGTDATITFYHGCITTKCQDEVLTFSKTRFNPCDDGRHGSAFE